MARTGSYSISPYSLQGAGRRDSFPGESSLALSEHSRRTWGGWLQL